MADFIAWHGKTLQEHQMLRDQWAPWGYRFLSLSIYGTPAAPVYAAVMIRRPVVVEQRDWPCLTASQWQQAFNDQAAQGFGPVILAATGSASDPRFAAVFQPLNPIPLTRHGLTSGDITDPNTIEGMNLAARRQGLILQWCASYGDSLDPRFAAIWMPNTGNELWNNDGVLDDANTYQSRFDAETAAWCRPAFVTLNSDNRYMALFMGGEIGPWVARHNMTPSDYQAEFNTWTAQGLLPIRVQASGATAASARFAALFAQSDNPVARQFHATGPVANGTIDAIVEQFMQAYPTVRHASLAIVHKKRLVYARGYTLAEPSWPIVAPTTCFRLASVSKTLTALAIYQLIEAGQLSLATTLQSVLQLTTPSGGAPVDPRFGAITIQHLLEHTSGLDPDGFADGVKVVQAFQAAGHAASLPVTQEMTDSYVASLPRVSDPGTAQVYSNCGYYLLGRVVARLRGTGSPIDAYQSTLCAPLGITRIRRAVDLLAAQPVDEARYQCGMTRDDQGNMVTPDLIVWNSLQSPAQPLVANGYGDYELAIAQGGGGLSAAAPDLARLVAIVIDPHDNPALKRATINAMLSSASALAAAHPNWRAGYGLDGAWQYGPDSFYGQKGGLIRNAASIFQFDGEWGIAFCMGSTANNTLGWYPDCHPVMDTARQTNWGTTDLFPYFGMPLL